MACEYVSPNWKAALLSTTWVFRVSTDWVVEGAVPDPPIGSPVPGMPENPSVGAWGILHGEGKTLFAVGVGQVARRTDRLPVTQHAARLSRLRIAQRHLKVAMER